MPSPANQTQNPSIPLPSSCTSPTELKLANIPVRPTSNKPTQIQLALTKLMQITTQKGDDFIQLPDLLADYLANLGG